MRYIYVGRVLHICSVLHVRGWGCGRSAAARENALRDRDREEGRLCYFSFSFTSPFGHPFPYILTLSNAFPSIFSPYHPLTLPIRIHMHTHAFMQVRKRGPYTRHCWKDAKLCIDQYYIHVCVSEIAVTHIILMMITWQ